MMCVVGFVHFIEEHSHYMLPMVAQFDPLACTQQHQYTLCERPKLYFLNNTR